MRHLSAIVLVSALLAACGGSSSEFTAGGAIPIDQLPGELAQSLCGAEKSCSPFFYGIAFGSADCKAQLSEQLSEESFGQIEVAVTGKTVNYDGVKARNCINEIASGSCSVLDNNLPAICREALSGTVATGGDCDIDAECSGLSRCEITAGVCPGTCAPLASAGVACLADGDCQLGLTCSEATHHCAAPAAEGEACKGGSAGECAAGLLCIGNDDSQMRAGTCRTEANALTAKLGGDCDLSMGPWCEQGLSCVVESLTTFKCHAIADAGGPCGLGVPSECPTGQYCPVDFPDLLLGNLTANCLPLPEEGEKCGPVVGIIRCAGNLVCDDSNALAPVCVQRHTLGQSCTSDALCNSTHCVNKTCVPESACAK